jgi:c-di-AMP phosphodiesterase-like protein
MLSEYRLKRDNFKRINKALTDLSDLINSIVARLLRIYYAECNILYDTLKALKLQLAVTDSILK